MPPWPAVEGDDYPGGSGQLAADRKRLKEAGSLAKLTAETRGRLAQYPETLCRQARRRVLEFASGRDADAIGLWRRTFGDPLNMIEYREAMSEWLTWPR